jgi:4-hydroxymandelate oxidase
MFVGITSSWAIRTHGDRQYPVVTEADAKAVLSEVAYDYYARGAGDEITRDDNVVAWRSWALLPQVLAGVETVDLGVELLGRPLRHPLVIAPMARHNLATPDAERATVAAAAASDTTCCVSVGSSVAPAELSRAHPDARLWFQQCIFRDRGITDELASVAAESGYACLVVTVDNPSVGLRNHATVRVGRPDQSAAPSGSATSLELDPSLTWRDLERFVARQALPVAVKGVLDPADAERAIGAGVSILVVSNHGGRQLDRAPATADALPAVVDRVGDRVPVLVDGGIRCGADVVTALALGARAVLVGRPILWGLATGGSEGAVGVISSLLEETATTMALAGLPSIADISRDRLRLTSRRSGHARRSRALE